MVTSRTCISCGVIHGVAADPGSMKWHIFMTAFRLSVERFSPMTKKTGDGSSM